MKISSLKEEGDLYTSRWISLRALLDPVEMEEALAILAPFQLYNTSHVVPLKDATFSLTRFLSTYSNYISSLKAGSSIESSNLGPTLSCTLSADPDAFYAVKIKEDGYVLKLLRPAIQLTFHTFLFSAESRYFHSMVHGKGAISWGMQFSYPQIYSNSLKGEVFELYKEKTDRHLNRFRSFLRHVRRYTLPTPFFNQGSRIIAPFRIGKKCLSWIHSHPELPPLGLTVARNGGDRRY